MNASTPAPDFVDRAQAAWQRSLPEADTSALEVFGRVHRISALGNRHLERRLQDAGVSRSEFDVLCALARADGPLRASEVSTQTMLSGAATTKLTSRLEAAGLLLRSKLPRDARVVLLELSDAGRELVARRFPEALSDDERVLGDLSPEERTQLASLLRRVLAGAESRV